MKDSNWDLDLRAGEAGESYISDLLHIDTVEVKTDRRWIETGNIYIETECWQNSTQTWESSGMRTSKATHWAYVLNDSVIIVPLGKLWSITLSIGYPITCDIPPNPSRGYLVKPSQLVELLRTI